MRTMYKQFWSVLSDFCCYSDILMMAKRNGRKNIAEATKREGDRENPLDGFLLCLNKRNKIAKMRERKKTE